ncbi:kinase-like domain-containing protein [Rhizophagus irregularis DAOM 181602=DAOM 197198]|nr:kinase-like domain-containing protein [Rhizophagus irregularis DAOM 181602=DAOM 197198]
MWEFTSGIPPFDNIAHNIQLSLSICKGECPEIIEYTPQCYVDLMKKCWDENPLKRPSSKEHNNLVTESHPHPCYTSRLLNFTSENLNKIPESEMLVSEDLNDYIIKDLKSLNENTSKKLRLESEDSQDSAKINEMLVINEDLSDVWLI